ncbi:MAG TPA: Ig-like domain-containing protein [Candidatus Sulfotelmatobacter sp.]|nr:Ig-like domain-containing protein [Candidatus Sulfotelmatobacter sp.]
MKTHLKTTLALLLTSTLLATSTWAQETKTVSVRAMPPSVVKTVPQAGDTAVDPNLKEISVTFSKDMLTDRMWAVCQISKETYPETNGEVHYQADKRTCVVPVKLEPGKTYVLWFNRGQFNSFRDTANNPAVPYLLVFQTKK